jgi:hypothetical protein
VTNRPVTMVGRRLFDFVTFITISGCSLRQTLRTRASLNLAEKFQQVNRPSLRTIVTAHDKWLKSPTKISCDKRHASVLTCPAGTSIANHPLRI